MPKLKTKRGVAKRFKLTKKGKVKYNPGGKSHLAVNKKTKQIRKMKKAGILEGSREIKFVKRMLPYG